MSWSVTLKTRPNTTPSVVDVTATYTDPVNPLISFSCSSTSKVSQAELDKFVTMAKAGLTAYLAAYNVDATRTAAVLAALNAP